MRVEVHVAATAVRDLRVELGRREVGVAEHLLDAAQIGAPFEQVRRERMAQEMRMHAAGLEAGDGREPAQDQERAGPREPAALCIEEELERWRRSRYGRPLER